jgi:hypothetical protein
VVQWSTATNTVTWPSSTLAVRVWSLAQTSLGRAMMIVPVCRFSAFRNMRDGASNCASRISRSTLAFDVRTRSGGSLDFLDSEL